MFNPSASTASKGTANKRAISEVTKWITDTITGRGIFSVDEFQVMVTEIQCNEPDCVPIETLVIIVLMSADGDAVTSSKGAQKWANKIMVPVAEVTKVDVVELINEIFPNSPVVTSSENAIVVKTSFVELFGSELRALIQKYKSTANSEDTRANQLLLIQTLQSHADVLRRNMPKEEAPALPPAIPGAEPVRTVTTVVMKSNTPKPVPDMIAPLSTASVPEASPIATAASSTPPISVRMANKSATTLSPVTTAPSSAVPEVPVPAPAPATTTAEPATAVKMSPAAAPTTAAPTPIITYSQPVPTNGATIAPRHKKGSTRPRGCPCCDPDNLDNIIDTMMFSHYPQT